MSAKAPALSARGYRAGLLLADVTNPALLRATRAVACQDLAAMTGCAPARVWAIARDIRRELGGQRGVSLAAWLSHAGWLVGDVERIPQAPPATTPGHPDYRPTRDEGSRRMQAVRAGMASGPCPTSDDPAAQAILTRYHRAAQGREPGEEG